MKTYPSIDFRVEQNAAFLEMHHGKANIIDFDLMKQLSDALDQAASFPVLVLTSGVADFSKGVDIKIHTPDQAPEMLRQFHAIIRRLYHFAGVTFCVLQGYALGGGLELALPCDLIAADKETRLGFPEIRLACFPPVAVTLLPLLIGRTAKRLLLTGDTIAAEEALSLGLIDRTFDSGSRERVVSEWIDTISSYSPHALRTLKRITLSANGFDFDAALAAAERTYVEELLQSADAAEGIEAFLQKRPPAYLRASRE